MLRVLLTRSSNVTHCLKSYTIPPVASFYCSFQKKHVALVRTVHLEHCNLIHSSTSLLKKKDKKGKKGPSTKQLEESLGFDDEVSEIINIQEYKHELNVALEHLQNDFIQQLSLRTSVSAFHNIQVKLGGGEKCLLGEIATIFMKTPTLCVINVSSAPEHSKDVVEALRASPLKINPQQDGTVISLTLPKVTMQHREELAKAAKSLSTKCKDHMRSVRNQFDGKVRKQEKHHSRDVLVNVTQLVQALYDDYISKADEMTKNKQAELKDAH